MDIEKILARCVMIARAASRATWQTDNYAMCYTELKNKYLAYARYWRSQL